MDASWLFSIAFLAGGGAAVVGAWLLTYALHSTVLLLAAWGVTALPALRWSPAARQAIWRLALVAGVATSAAQLAAPALSRGGTLRLTEAARTSVAAVQVLQRTTGNDRATPSPSFAPPGPAAFPPAPRPASFEGTAVRVLVFGISRAAIAVALWALVALVLLVRMTLAGRRLSERLASRRPARNALATHALRHLATHAGVTRHVTLTVSDALAAPAAISSREIVVPSRVLSELSLAEQEGILAHELAHVVRHDTRWLRLAAWIERLAWFQPLNRVARRQMQLDAEFAADAWAVRLTRQPLALARALARVAEWVAPPRSRGWREASGLGAMAGADGSPLVERVRRLTTPPPAAGPPPRLHGASAAAMMASAALLALAFLPRVDAGARNAPSHDALARRNERVEIRRAPRVPQGMATDERHPPDAATPVAPTTTTHIRLLRVGTSPVGAVPKGPGIAPRVLFFVRHIS